MSKFKKGDRVIWTWAGYESSGVVIRRIEGRPGGYCVHPDRGTDAHKRRIDWALEEELRLEGIQEKA